MLTRTDDNLFDDGDPKADQTIDRYLYHGDDLDVEAGLQAHRHFDPTVGRWINEDPIGYEAGDANLYRYVGNAPCNDSDPTVE